MKKSVVFFVVVLIAVMLVGCSNDVTDENNKKVEAVYIDAILNRKIFMESMYSIYTTMISDIDTMLNSHWKDMTFRDLLNEDYFINDASSWQYHLEEDNFKSVIFTGIGKGVFDDLKMVVEFVFMKESSVPLVIGYMMGDMDDENVGEITAVSLSEKYDCDYAEAVLYCDATFSNMLTLSLVDIPKSEYKNNSYNVESEENTNLNQKFESVPYKVRTDGDVLNIRSGSGTEYDVIGFLEDGCDVVVTEVKNGWGYIVSSYGVSGWSKGKEYEKIYGWVCMDYLEVIPCSP